MRKEAVVTYFKYHPEEHKKLSRKPNLGPRLEAGTSRMRSKAAHWTKKFVSRHTKQKIRQETKRRKDEEDK
jgi:hypothetical protein